MSNPNTWDYQVYFYPAHSKVTLTLFFFFYPVSCNFLTKDMQVLNRTTTPSSLSSTQLAVRIQCATLINVSFHWFCLFALQFSWFIVSCCANSILVPCTVFKNKIGVHCCRVPFRYCISNFLISLVFHSSVDKHMLNFLCSWA